MKNPIKAFLARRQRRRALRAQLALLSNFSTFEKLQRANLIFFDQKNRRLYIEQPVAVMMIQSAQTWTNFLRAIHDWQYLEQCNTAWRKYYQKEELAAVREATRTNKNLTAADIARIRRARRTEIALSDITAPAIADYEYFIIKEAPKNIPAHPSPSQEIPAAPEEAAPVAAAEILAVGHYTAATGMTEIASWDDIRQFMSAGESA